MGIDRGLHFPGLENDAEAFLLVPGVEDGVRSLVGAWAGGSSLGTVAMVV